MAGCIDNVENHGETVQGLVGNSCDFGCDGNSSLLSKSPESMTTRQGFGGRWVITLFGCHQQLVYHGCFAMIDVGNSGHIANPLTSKGFEIHVHRSSFVLDRGTCQKGMRRLGPNVLVPRMIASHCDVAGGGVSPSRGHRRKHSTLVTGKRR